MKSYLKIKSLLNISYVIIFFLFSTIYIKQSFARGAACTTCMQNTETNIKDVSKKIKNIAPDVIFDTKITDGNQWLDVTLKFKTKWFFMPSVSEDLKNDSGVNFGKLIMDSQSIQFNLNITSLTRAPQADPLLPNGQPIPTKFSSIVSSVVLAENARLYFGADSTSQSEIFGFALPINFTPLNKFGETFDDFDLFPAFSIPKSDLVNADITLEAGFFAGKDLGTTGIGIFIKYQSLPPVVTTPPTTTTVTTTDTGSTTVTTTSVISTTAVNGATVTATPLATSVPQLLNTPVPTLSSTTVITAIPPVTTTVPTSSN